MLRLRREHGRFPPRRRCPGQASVSAERAHHDPPASWWRAGPGALLHDPRHEPDATRATVTAAHAHRPRERGLGASSARPQDSFDGPHSTDACHVYVASTPPAPPHSLTCKLTVTPSRATQAADIEIQAKEILYIRACLNTFIADYTGQPVEKIEEDCDRDFFMTPEEAVDYGIIDEVSLPALPTDPSNHQPTHPSANQLTNQPTAT